MRREIEREKEEGSEKGKGKGEKKERGRGKEKRGRKKKRKKKVCLLGGAAGRMTTERQSKREKRKENERKERERAPTHIQIAQRTQTTTTDLIDWTTDSSACLSVKKVSPIHAGTHRQWTRHKCVQTQQTNTLTTNSVTTIEQNRQKKKYSTTEIIQKEK